MLIYIPYSQMMLGKLQSIAVPDPESLAISDYQKLLVLSNNQRQSYYRFLHKTQSDKIDQKVTPTIKCYRFARMSAIISAFLLANT